MKELLKAIFLKRPLRVAMYVILLMMYLCLFHPFNRCDGCNERELNMLKDIMMTLIGSIAIHEGAVKFAGKKKEE